SCGRERFEHVAIHRQQRVEQRQAVERSPLRLCEQEEGQRPNQHRRRVDAQRFRFTVLVRRFGRRHAEALAALQLGDDVVVVGVEALRPFHRADVATFALPAACHRDVPAGVHPLACETVARRHRTDHRAGVQHAVGAVPPRYGFTGQWVDPGTYFAMARGSQGKGRDVTAMEMTKWFDTNYHYIVPELERSQRFRMASAKPANEYREAKALGIDATTVLIGPLTFLLLAKTKGGAFDRLSLLDALLSNDRPGWSSAPRRRWGKIACGWRRPARCCTRRSTSISRPSSIRSCRAGSRSRSRSCNRSSLWRTPIARPSRAVAMPPRRFVLPRGSPMPLYT